MKRLAKVTNSQLAMAVNSLSLKSLKWSDIYEDEDALIFDMFRTISDASKSTNYSRLVKGYQYIDSFKAYYNKYGKLTDKQRTQLKRLAVSIAYNVYVIQGK